MPADIHAQNRDLDEQALIGATQTRLAYIKTGNKALDQMSEEGLFGLGRVLHKRTNIGNLLVDQNINPGVDDNETAAQQVMPYGIDPAKDALVFFPVIYWAIDPAKPLPTSEAIEKLNEYIKSGGQLFIDTRDLSTNNRGRAWLKRAQDKGLHIPALKRVEGCDSAQQDCHVIGKSFYLLDHFPGRYAGGDLLIERTDSLNNDGVAGVIIGRNEYAAAWAMDVNERPLYAVIGNDPEQREYALRVGINWVMYAFTGNYKADQIHIPSILQRMEPSAN